MKKKSPNQFRFRIRTLLKWFSHPVFIFVTLQVVWIAITLIWVIWFLDSAQEIKKLSEDLGHPHLNNHYTLVILVVGCILLGVILLGTVILFVKTQQQSNLMNQQKSFVSSVTHELRSPLASLQLTFETMRARTLDTSTSRKLLDMASEDTQRLTRLVDQILVSSRLDRGIYGIEDKSENIYFYDFLQKISMSLYWLEPHIKKRLKIDCPQSLVVHAPISIMRLIVSNLLENAIKYSPEKSSIVLKASRINNRMTLSFQDQGFGLTKKEKKRIFRMFYRATITNTKAIPGTGLGLFMVKTLVQSLGGKTWVESPGRDQGSIFYISIPEH